MRKILVVGYLGFENFGDEALLHVLIRDLLLVGFYRDDITVVSNKPALTTGKFDVRSIGRWNLFEVFFEVIRCEAIVFIGGLFQDKTSFRSFLYYFLYLLFAKMVNREIVFYGAGIGPLDKKLSRQLFVFGTNSLRLATVRDQVSTFHLASFLSHSSVTCDPVWTIETDFTFKSEIPKVNWQMPILGVSMKNDKNLKRRFLLNIADKIARVLIGMKDWQVLLIPCVPNDDLPVLYELVDLLDRKVAEHERVILLENFNQFSILKQAGILASVDVMVSMRYHALLVPLAHEKPVFGLVFDQKVKSLIDFGNQVSAHFRDDLDQPWSYFWQNLPHSVEVAKKAISRAKELHKKNIELLERLLGDK